jgi:hypothetical protein
LRPDLIIQGGGMRASICIATLMGAMGIVTDAAAVESDAGLLGKRGLSPITNDRC